MTASEPTIETLATQIAQLESGIARLTAERDVRAVMMRYMELCDRLDASTPMDELGSLFTIGARWVGKGARYGEAFGAHEGRAAIVAMLDSYRGPVPHFVMNAHFLGSETISVDGGRAVGRWMMLQTSTYADGRSDLRSARLEVRFAHEDGGWRISRFETENLFSRTIDRWDDAAAIPVPEVQGERR